MNTSKKQHPSTRSAEISGAELANQPHTGYTATMETGKRTWKAPQVVEEDVRQTRGDEVPTLPGAPEQAS